MSSESKDRTETVETATLAGGCFWCLEAAYEQVRGIVQVVPGYAGGHTNDPSYEQICTGQSGHAEVVQLLFDPSVISYGEVLDIFFLMHDPTTLNRQGYDVGTQYRSAIYFHSKEQRIEAESYIANPANQKLWDDPIVTEVTPLSEFYLAEEYHHEYFRKNINASYCQYIIEPKLAKLRKEKLQALKI